MNSFPVTRPRELLRKDHPVEAPTVPPAPVLHREGLVTITGFDKTDVLFRSDGVGLIQIRDADGDLVALFIRKNRLLWLFCARGDPDWDETVRLFANPDEGIACDRKSPAEAKGVSHDTR